MLQKGQVIKNYKELCEIMSWKVSAGKQKQIQLKDLERYCIFHKEGHKFIIDEVYSSPKEKIDNRKNQYTQFKIPDSKWNNTGVYIIIDENKNCYIGSTTKGFRHRFRNHWSGNMQYTYDLIHDNSSEFKILEDMTGKSEHEIRKREDELIREYEENPEYNVINRLCGVAGFNGERIDKLEKIKIKGNNYFDAIRILNENGIEVIL